MPFDIRFGEVITPEPTEIECPPVAQREDGFHEGPAYPVLC
jgi:hypothetical protein